MAKQLAAPQETTTVSTYADKIRMGWNKCVDGILEAGRWAHEANQTLSAREKKDLYRAIPMSPASFSRLALIGKDQRLLATDVKAKLPANASAITEIARLDDAQLGLAMSQQVIHPDARREQIKALRTGEVPKKVAPAVRSPKVLVARVFADPPNFEQAAALVEKLAPPCKIEVAPHPKAAQANREAAFFRQEGKKAILELTGLISLGDPRAIERSGWERDEIVLPNDAGRGDVEQFLTNLGLHQELADIQQRWGRMEKPETPSNQ